MENHYLHPSPVPPSDSPRQQGRGPAAGDEAGGQRDQSSQPLTDLVPPSDSPRQQGRGPAAGDEAGGQGEQYQFSSTDVRTRQSEEEKEHMSVSTIIGHLNKFCFQKPGGGFDLPKMSDSEFCVLCNNGCKCFGPSCKGSKPPSDYNPGRGHFQPTSCIIPGLEESSSSTSTSCLTTREVTHSKKIYMSGPVFRPNSSIFTWRKPTTSCAGTNSHGQEKEKLQKPKIDNKAEKSWYDTISHSTKKKILAVLLKPALNTSKTKRMKSSAPPHIQSNSLARRLSISELACPRKSQIKSRVTIFSDISSSNFSRLSSYISSTFPISFNSSNSTSSNTKYWESVVAGITDDAALIAAATSDGSTSGTVTTMPSFSTTQATPAAVIEYLKEEWHKVENDVEIVNMYKLWL